VEQRRPGSTAVTLVGMLGLNLLVMVAGCVVTVAGATRFVT